MDFEPQATVKTAPEKIEFAQPTQKKPLELLRDTEALLRRKTVAALVPILPSRAKAKLKAASVVADESLQELAQVDLDKITDAQLRPARILIGLSFVGFGALMIVLLLLYLHTLHPEQNPMAQMRQYWYEYVWFVCLGVAGMFMLGREAMR